MGHGRSASSSKEARGVQSATEPVHACLLAIQHGLLFSGFDHGRYAGSVKVTKVGGSAEAPKSTGTSISSKPLDNRSIPGTNSVRPGDSISSRACKNLVMISNTYPALDDGSEKKARRRRVSKKGTFRPNGARARLLGAALRPRPAPAGQRRPPPGSSMGPVPRLWRGGLAGWLPVA